MLSRSHLIVADSEACRMTPVERQGRPTKFPNWIALVEGFTFEAVAAVGTAELSDERMLAYGAALVERDTYVLQFTQMSTQLSRATA